MIFASRFWALRRPARWAAALALFSTLVWAGQEIQAEPGEPVVPGEFLVRLSAAAGDARGFVTAVRQLRAQAEALDLDGYVVVRAGNGADPAEVSRRLAELEEVDLVEPNRIRELTIAAPSDPASASQWALNMIRAREAWQYLPGRYFNSSNPPPGRIRVAVLDTGSDCTHDDFKNGGTSTNSSLGGQLNWSLSGAPVATAVASPACAWQDDHSHGTHVAGIIAMSANNGMGGAGAGYALEIMTYKVLSQVGSGSDSTIANAIVQAANAGAHVISMSLGGTGYSQTLQDAITYAWSKDVAVVVAAGNLGSSSVYFPAHAFHALAVASVNSTGARSSFSNFGLAIGAAAPGESIYATIPSVDGSPRWGNKSGTSMATPHVSAVAGLLRMASPGLSAEAIRARIFSSSVTATANGGWNDQLGWGRIDAYRALSGREWRTTTVGGIEGQVTTPSGVAITSASVSAAGQSRTTAAGGRFRFANLTPGEYVVTCSASGYAALNIPVVVVPGADTPVACKMGTAFGAVQGVVSGPGGPLAGASVQLLRSGLVEAAGFTDQNGFFKIGAPAGTYQARVSAFRYAPTTVSIPNLTSGGLVTANLSTTEHAYLRGNTRNGSAAVSGAEILAVSGNTSFGALTDAEGNYETVSLPAGSYNIQASKSGLTTQSVSGYGITAGGAATVDFNFGTAGPTVSLAPLTAALGPNGVQDFTASLSGATGTLQWSLSPSTGTLTTLSATSVRYRAPASIAARQTVTLRVTLQSDPTVTATAAIIIDDPHNVVLSPVSMVGGTSASTHQVVLRTAAAANENCALSSSNTSLATVPPSVTIPAGQTSGTFTISTSASASSQAVAITAVCYGIAKSANLTVTPPALSALTLQASTFASGTTYSSNRVTLTGPAPSGGVAVTLTNPDAAALTVPASVTVPAGASEQTFTITAGYPSTVATVTLTASHAGVSRTATVTVQPVALTGITVSPTSLKSGATSAASSVTLGAAAGGGGIVVSLTSSNPAAAAVPSSVTVPAGSSSANFTITAGAVAASTAVTITATFGGVSRSGSVTIVPVQVHSVSLGATSVTGGNALAGNVVTLDSPAPAGGVVVSLSSSSGAASVPATLTIPAGASSGAFTISTSAVASSTAVTITASLHGSSRTASLTVAPATISSFTLTLASVSAAGGQSVLNNRVSLPSAAPLGGVTVFLASSNAAALQVPASITIAAGQTTGYFTITTTPVAADTAVTITATSGSIVRSASFTVNAPVLTGFTLSPVTLTGGGSVTATVTISSPAPAGGLAITVTRSSTLVSAPASITVPAGATSASVTFSTSPVSSQTQVTVTASRGSVSVPVTLTLNPPILTNGRS
jgi:subtilisin family serine protease